MRDDKEEAQDERVEQLWRTLDTRNQGQLDVPGLREGLRKINHREASTTRLDPYKGLILTTQLYKMPTTFSKISWKL
jgi:hypothetical protein